jgi:PRTRC genetic system protein A
MRPVGYLVNREKGPADEPGLFYDYILAGNGLFVRAQSFLLKATVCIAPTSIRGLLPLEEKVELAQGRIPRRLYDLALSILMAESYHERYLAVTWEGEYRLRSPLQESGEGGVKYEVLPSTVLDIHSHGTMRAFFSGTDNSDEQGLGLYMVVGRLDTMLPEVEVRTGVYGYFAHLKVEDVFSV